MQLRTQLRALTLLTLSIGIAGCGQTSNAPSPEVTRAIAMEAYIYAFPLVVN